MEKKVCIAIVPSPGRGHMIPLVEFAKHLVQQRNEFHVTFLVPTLGPPPPSTIAIFNALPPNIDATFLPQNIEDLQINPHPIAQIRLAVELSLPSLHAALSSLGSRTHLVALVLDFFSIYALDVAKQLNLLSYAFFSGATALSFSLCFPELDESVSSSDQFLDLTQTMNVPGCAVPFRIKDLPELIHLPRSNEVYKAHLNACQRLSLVDGIIVNTFTDLEAGPIRAIEQREANNRNGAPFLYSVGPIIQTKSSTEVNKLECVRWLDNQPPKSVLYISFGSGGTIPHDQLNEIALGLELSGHKFLWVVRAPNKDAGSGYLAEQKKDPLQYLPSGFLDRIKVKGQGLVVPTWAPQIEILGHGSTGGFLTQCGWNSVLECVVHGLPSVAWPLFAEQEMNAILLTDVLKVAGKPKADEENGIISREEIAKVVKRIMEGDESLEMRKRIKALSDAAAVALSENGSSNKALSSLTQKWLNI